MACKWVHHGVSAKKPETVIVRRNFVWWTSFTLLLRLQFVNIDGKIVWLWGFWCNFSVVLFLVLVEILQALCYAYLLNRGLHQIPVVSFEDLHDRIRNPFVLFANRITVAAAIKTFLLGLQSDVGQDQGLHRFHTFHSFYLHLVMTSGLRGRSVHRIIGGHLLQNSAFL